MIILAYERGYFNNFGKMKREILEAALRKSKFSGCSIRFDEIEEYLSSLKWFFMQQFLEVNPSKHVKIIIDKRDDSQFEEEFSKLGAKVEWKMLDVGDFLCSHRTVVERKTRSDFESSIIDGRLFSQLTNLKHNYDSVIIVVEGTGEFERIQKKAILGAYATIMTDYNASLFFTKSIKGTAELVYSVARHEQFAKKQPLRIFAKRKTHTISQTQRSIIEMLPMVGPKLAKNLLKHFGNVEDVINASERDLSEVEGMGKKRVKAIKSIISYDYDPEEDKTY